MNPELLNEKEREIATQLGTELKYATKVWEIKSILMGLQDLVNQAHSRRLS